MSKEALDQIALVFVCFTAAGMLVYYLRHYLRPRKKGESMAAFVARAEEEKRLDRIAKTQMFGSWTVTLHSASIALILAILWLSQYSPVFLFGAAVYVIAGVFLTKQPAEAARRPDYDRLGRLDRMQYRMMFAWAWPYYFLKRTS